VAAYIPEKRSKASWIIILVVQNYLSGWQIVRDNWFIQTPSIQAVNHSLLCIISFYSVCINYHRRSFSHYWFSRISPKLDTLVLQRCFPVNSTLSFVFSFSLRCSLSDECFIYNTEHAIWFLNQNVNWLLENNGRSTSNWKWIKMYFYIYKIFLDHNWQLLLVYNQMILYSWWNICISNVYTWKFNW